MISSFHCQPIFHKIARLHPHRLTVYQNIAQLVMCGRCRWHVCRRRYTCSWGVIIADCRWVQRSMGDRPVHILQWKLDLL